jgi:hypothetical protein
VVAMFAINAENEFGKDNLYYCYSPKLKKYLCKTKNISYIGKGINDETKRTYWLFIKTDELSKSLLEWSDNASKGVKAIE